MGEKGIPRMGGYRPRGIGSKHIASHEARAAGVPALVDCERRLSLNRRVGLSAPSANDGRVPLRSPAWPVLLNLHHDGRRDATYLFNMLKRSLLSLLLGYVLLGLITRAREAAGAYTCGCDPDCWCKRPGLSLFRWVFPRFHRNSALADWKREQFEG